tara:strand:- start:34492 stop:35142 length:651 start_codon:yes stop_codon:yes gene_type:complete
MKLIYALVRIAIFNFVLSLLLTPFWAIGYVLFLRSYGSLCIDILSIDPLNWFTDLIAGPEVWSVTCSNYECFQVYGEAVLSRISAITISIGMSNRLYEWLKGRPLIKLDLIGFYVKGPFYLAQYCSLLLSLLVLIEMRWVSAFVLLLISFGAKKMLRNAEFAKYFITLVSVTLSAIDPALLKDSDFGNSFDSLQERKSNSSENRTKSDELNKDKVG